MNLPIQSQPVMRYVSTAKMTSSNIQPSDFQCIRTCQMAGDEIGGTEGVLFEIACMAACDYEDIKKRRDGW
jgi:hypothetical protein